MLCKNIFAFTVGIFLPIASLFAEIADGYAKRFLIAPGQKLGLTAYSSLEDFPVLVRLSTSIVGFDYADFKKSDVVAGEKVPSDLDILFVDENGTELSYEIQVWNPEGVSLVWVKVPTLTVNSQITCYFGNAEELKSNNPNDTWVAYAGVWHLDDIGEGGTSPDSTSNGYTAICTSSTKSTTGIPSTDDDPLGVGGYRENVGKRTVEEGDLPNGTGSGVIFEGTQNLKPSDQTHFTVSGWFRRNHINNGWDHLFYKKNESKGGDGWGMEMNKEKTYPANLDVFGIWEAYNGATLNHGIAIADKWYYLSIVFDGQTRKLYNNGSLLSSGKSMDWALPNWKNDLKIALGNDSDQNGSVFQGSFDEPRLRLVSYDDVWAKAEYESMASVDSLAYSDVVAAAAATPIIENVLLNRDINGVFALSVSLSDDSSAGDVSIIINEKNTIEIAKNVSAGENVEYALENLDSDMGYSVRVVLTDAIGQSDTKQASSFITGEVSVVGNGFAKEEGVIESGFTFSRPVSASAYELEVAYSIAGTAERGSSYEALSGVVVFPAGVSEVVVPVKPIINSSVDDDVNVVVTVLPGLYIASENSASVIIDNYRVIDGSSSLIAISEPDVIYSGNEVAISLAVRNGAGTLSVTLDDENGNTYEREIAASASGTGTVVKKASELDLPTGHWYTLKKAFANGEDASYDDRYTDIKFFMGTVCVHRILDAYEYGLAKGRFRIAIEGECMTSSDIALKYEIGGSASAGREYVALSGAATISAGTAYVDIYVTPMDNGFEGNTKLTVSLASDANTSLVSLNPAVAEIAIVDNSANIDINHFHKKLWLETSGISNAVLSNFPALIRIREGLRGFSYSDLEDCASGSDLAFADAEGNIIPHEIECWNPEGESTIWVKIPLLRNGTRIRMCYGGPALVSKVSSIWSAYKSVWHLNEPEGSKEFANAQGDRMIGVNHNTIYSDGVVGPARRISEGQRGVDDNHYIAVKDYNTSGVQGIINSDNAHKNFSMWLRYPVGQTPSKDILVQQQYQEGDAYGWTIRLAENSSGLYTACNYEGKNSVGVFDDLTDGEWHHLVVVFDSDKRYIYVDGELRTRMTDVKAIAGDWSWQPMAWGGYMNGNNQVSFKGWMDEIRFGAGVYPAPEAVGDDSVEGGVRYVAPALIKAEYKNVKEGIFRIVRDGFAVIVR